ncbi:hypothetical protein [Haloarcula nitratireducens]|uniref:ArsR family transcriptional regulator n=1 Tax=Haloarcula nitratireducens TaxID=2487749 RepID=A0AAW4PD49_9EURY|nr:hypothetical protein [Halomicroarcula nitratireducens]MBX0295528.1 hypothetical protein [Halomicroarcula nitratireducens]
MTDEHSDPPTTAQTRTRGRERSVSHLMDALDTDEVAEKNYVIREVLQLLTVTDSRSGQRSVPPELSDTSLDAIFETLSRPVRRRILLALAERGECDETEFITETFADGESDDALAAAKQGRIRVHLQKLAAREYVEWDREAETIRRGPNFEEVAPLLELIEDAEAPGREAEEEQSADSQMGADD